MDDSLIISQTTLKRFQHFQPIKAPGNTISIFKIVISHLSFSEQKKADNMLNEIKHYCETNTVIDVSIEVIDEDQNWQSQASFIFDVLKILSTVSCKLLLVDHSSSSFSDIMEGACLSLAKELTTFSFAHITLQKQEELPTIESFFSICFDEPGNHFYLKDNQLHNKQWQSIEFEPPNCDDLSGNIIIIGGNGAIGQLLTQYLNTHQQCSIFIVGRKQLTDEQKQFYTQHSVKSYFQIDAQNFELLEKTFNYISDNFGHIESVFHLAGTLSDSLFINKTKDVFLTNLKSKISVANNIARLSQHFTPKNICLFSSITAVVGNEGQTDYAAANNYLNGLCQRQNAHGYSHWFSINWGLWKTDSGMQMIETDQMKALAAKEGFKTLEQIIAAKITISTIYKGNKALLMPPTINKIEQSENTISDKTVKSFIEEVIEQCTKIKNIDHNTSLLSCGVDSILATHVSMLLEKKLSTKEFGVSIPKTLLFQYSSINDICTYLQTTHSNALELNFSDHSLTPDVGYIPQKKEDKKTEAINNNETLKNAFAIISMSGEFPGANNINELWQLLENETCAITPIPEDRWTWQTSYHPNKHNPGSSYCRHGGFISKAKYFANDLFNIPPREAIKLSPEVRRILHQSHYALGHCPNLISQSNNIGVFIANMYSHYQDLNRQTEMYDASLSACANYVSHAFKLTGPSIGIDSMCSGGLSALNTAINSLQTNECEAALVGGVNIMSHPGKYRFLSENKFLSPSGKCHTFGIDADGYVPGEGCIVLVLKRYQDAIEHNDKILGVIRGCAVNSNGSNSPLTVPSVDAQVQVIQKAIKKSGVNINDISYVEAHGTGTSLGDPIEVEALQKVYGSSHKLAIGSVKSNLGHLEAASGLTSIVKVLLQMHYKKKVSSLHCSIENPLLNLQESAIYIQKKCEPWLSNSKHLFAGITALGAGGSNAHIILQSPPTTHMYSHLPQPSKRLISSVFWPEKITNTVLPAATEKKATTSLRSAASSLQETLLLSPSKIDCASPLINQNNDQQTIFIISHAQILELNTNDKTLNFINESELTDALISDHTKETTWVNLIGLCNDLSESQHLKKQFHIAKYFSQTASKGQLINLFSAEQKTKKECCTSAISGLFKVLKLEKTDLNVYTIKTNEHTYSILKVLVNKRINKSETNYQFYLNQSTWQKETLNEIPLATSSSSLCKKNGTYLVSGGLGEVGRIICRYLLAEYDATIIILGRSNLKDKKQTLFLELKNINQNVHYYQTDITNKNILSATIEKIIAVHGKINGIVNAACILKDSLLREKTFRDFSQVILTKIQGTNFLDELTAHLVLDFFCNFSSLSSVFANVGQADYCAANTYVDNFIQWRDTQVTQGTRFGKSISINWPLWEVDNSTLTSSDKHYIQESTGIIPITAEQGSLLFDALINTHLPSQVIPLQGNQSDIKQKIQNNHVEDPNSNDDSNSISSRNMIDTIINCIHTISQYDTEKLLPNTNINDLGLSSVLLTELAKVIEKECGIAIAPSAFFSYNTIEKISNYLVTKLPEAQDIPDNLSPSSTSSSSDHYAIIGFSSLLPNGKTPEEFWQNLINKQSSIISAHERLGPDTYASLLNNIRGFDNNFFNLSYKEAMLMDPQHRLFLQSAYEALLNAGYPPEQVNQVGVFGGIQFNDYQHLMRQKKIPAHPYSATGNAHAMLANRVSYIFNFNGPSLTIDTACSSTLVAINRGIDALKNNECELALCGAVSLLIDPNVHDAAKSMGVLSPNYRCATFDEQADGYVRGEGVGVFVIKKLSDANRDKDAIHAIILSKAENHGGRANSLTAPNPLIQKELLIKAYHAPETHQVSYIETHGTGTKLGDPIELDALHQAHEVIFKNNATKKPIHIGSVKSNVGHLEPAAGVASLVKIIMSMKHNQLPPNIHLNKLNPYIHLDKNKFTLVREITDWQDDHNQIAGISSFGFGGSNCHLVLQAPSHFNDDRQEAPSIPYPFVLSAKTPTSLKMMKQKLAEFLSTHPSISLLSLSYVLCCHRTHFQHRFGIQSNNINELIKALGENDPHNINTSDNLTKYLQGQDVLWSEFKGKIIQKVHVPGYCFDEKDIWFNDTSTQEKEKKHA